MTIRDAEILHAVGQAEGDPRCTHTHVLWIERDYQYSCTMCSKRWTPQQMEQLRWRQERRHGL